MRLYSKLNFESAWQCRYSLIFFFICFLLLRMRGSVATPCSFFFMFLDLFSLLFKNTVAVSLLLALLFLDFFHLIFLLLRMRGSAATLCSSFF